MANSCFCEDVRTSLLHTGMMQGEPGLGRSVLRRGHIETAVVGVQRLRDLTAVGKGTVDGDDSRVVGKSYGEVIP